MRWRNLSGYVVSIFIACSSPVFAQIPDKVDSSEKLEIKASGLFVFADAADARGDYAAAETAYRALIAHQEGELRNEARFRLSMMLAYHQRRYRAAAIELRKILDEKPETARVRLELARIDALLGDVGSAGRELRAAQAAGLPPEVEKVVRFYAQALDARRPTGGSIEVTLAPDSNVNRATSSGTLGTVLGNFSLSQDARAQAGVGLSVRSQAFARFALSNSSNLLTRLSGSATVYRLAMFDDMILAPQIGPELVRPRDRFSVSVGPVWRWFGVRPYTFAWAGSANWQHAIGRRSQLRIDGSVSSTDNRRNALESGNSVSLALGVDRAFSARMGGGLYISAARQDARDPAYAVTSARIGGYAYREIGKATITANTSYGHLEADMPLNLFPDRRIDDSFLAGVSGTFRHLRVGAIVPLVRFTFERQASSIKLYDYRRFAAEIGVNTAF